MLEIAEMLEVRLVSHKGGPRRPMVQKTFNISNISAVLSSFSFNMAKGFLTLSTYLQFRVIF